MTATELPDSFQIGRTMDFNTNMTELKKNLAIKQTLTWACSVATPFNQESILLVCPLLLVTFMTFLASIFECSGPTRGWKPRKVELLAPCGGLQFKFPGFSLLQAQKTQKSHQKIQKSHQKEQTNQENTIFQSTKFITPTLSFFDCWIYIVKKQL